MAERVFYVIYFKLVLDVISLCRCMFWQRLQIAFDIRGNSRAYSRRFWRPLFAVVVPYLKKLHNKWLGKASFT